MNRRSKYEDFLFAEGVAATPRVPQLTERAGELEAASLTADPKTQTKKNEPSRWTIPPLPWQTFAPPFSIPRFHVFCVLNHISDTGGASAVTAVYDRNAYVQEKRRALNKWASRLSEIVGDVKPAANVVEMKVTV